MNSQRGSEKILVHAEVMGQGEIEGITFGHAFVIEGGYVFDKSNGRNIVLPKELYYAAGEIDAIGNIHTYDYNQLQEKIIKFGHWGPWDLVTRSGL